MKILFVASEINPLAKVGGLADVIGALPKALKNLGLDVRVVIPKYDTIDPVRNMPRNLLSLGNKIDKKNSLTGHAQVSNGVDQTKYNLELIDQAIPVEVADEKETINLYSTILPNTDVLVYLIDNEKYFGRNGIYFEKTAFCGSLEEIKRFLFFSKAVLEMVQRINWQPEIIHCHDWHTAFLPVLIKMQPKTLDSRQKTLLTIHNLANQGKWSAQKILDFLKLKGDEIPSLKNRQFGLTGEEINLLQQGILTADLLTTVSPSYAQEILTEEFGEGLEKTLEKREKDLFGILNGLDVDFFNPATDSFIYQNYSNKTIKKKIKNKTELQKELELEISREKPLFALISRLVKQKGIDLILKIVDQIVELGCQMIFLGVGLEKYEEKLIRAQQKYPRQISANLKFDPILAQKIYAGSDFFLMPSKFEPCGLGQLIALRYGTIPIVRATGGLKDTVKDIKTRKFLCWFGIKGNGLVFKGFDSQELFQKIREAKMIYCQPEIYEKIQIKGMEQNFSWSTSARKYLDLYQRLIK